MSAAASLARPALSEFARDVEQGLSARVKKLSPQYLYDDLGSALFETITLLPEYGLTRADERVLARHARAIAQSATIGSVAELGSGSGRKTRHVLEALQKNIVYQPIDVSAAALEACQEALSEIARVHPVRGDWMEGLHRISAHRGPGALLVLFLGSSIGNLEREEIPAFLQNVRAELETDDLFLVGFDLVKETKRMIEAYDDPTGVTAAFNLNLLGRINRELSGGFDLRAFGHEARWNAERRRMEMHLVSHRRQSVGIGALETKFAFEKGETIWTESSHKFGAAELPELARAAQFEPVDTWVDAEWPFAETLWRAV